jgi:hemerythrin superfamily protein
MDAITLLVKDHQTVESLFEKFEQTGPRAMKARKALADRIVHELSVHAAIEEQVLYPAIRESLPEVTDDVLEALEEHHVAKWVLSEIDAMSPEHERFQAKVTVLMENVRHHVEEEEEELFPKVRKAISAEQLEEIGEALAGAKKIAPTRPHPKAPDTPPGNIAAGTGAALLDKARDAGRRAKKQAQKKAAGATTKKAPAKKAAGRSKSSR